MRNEGSVWKKFFFFSHVGTPPKSCPKELIGVVSKSRGRYLDLEDLDPGSGYTQIVRWIH